MGTRIFMHVCAAALVALGGQAHAETVVPMQGQTPAQIQADTDACKAQAKAAYDQAQTQQQQSQQQAQQQSATAAQSADAASKQAFSSCMSAKGYTISP
jgi:hypothetical protein